MLGKTGQEEKGATDDEMVGWHHQLNGHEFEQTLRDSEGQMSLPCCNPRGHKESDMNLRLNKSNISMAESLCCPPETITTLL